MTEIPAHHAVSGRSNFSSSQKQLIYDELEKILASAQFENAPTVSAFLDYVVRECLAGNDDYIKAYTIATEGMGRSERFDPTADTIVRTTAGRLRKTLRSYYNDRETRPQVIISLPKGRYIPSFEFTGQPPPPDTQPPAKQENGGVSALFMTVAACTIALMVFGIAAFLQWQSTADLSPAEIVVSVHPTEFTTPQEELLAKALDFRLAAALARIGVAEIIPPDRLSYTDRSPPTVNDKTIRFSLEVTVLNDENPNLLWKLLDSETGRILWTGSQPLLGADADSLFLVVDRLAFNVLGMGGAVPLTLERYYEHVFNRSTCISRAQIVELVEDSAVFPATRNCLENIVSASPNDASAWAVLSIMYTDRSRFYEAETGNVRTAMIKQAEQAAEKAARLSPTAYLTKAALMHLALRQGRIEDFDRLQQEIRARYPGDIFLQIRIATRLARLGRSKEALEIFDKAETEFGINLKNWSPGIAVAYFAEGDYERAYQEIMRSSSGLKFVLVLKAAILGKLDRKDEAAPLINQILHREPDISQTLQPWLVDLGWADPVILDVADGLTKAGLPMPVYRSEHLRQSTPGPVAEGAG